MMICPRCGFPFQQVFTIVAEQDIRCDTCHWSGPSSELILAKDGQFKDPRVFNDLYYVLAKEISPVVGAHLIRLGLLNATPNAESVKAMALTLIHYTNAGFKSLLLSILGEQEAKPHE